MVVKQNGGLNHFPIKGHKLRGWGLLYLPNVTVRLSPNMERVLEPQYESWRKLCKEIDFTPQGAQIYKRFLLLIVLMQ